MFDFITDAKFFKINFVAPQPTLIYLQTKSHPIIIFLQLITMGKMHGVTFGFDVVEELLTFHIWIGGVPLWWAGVTRTGPGSIWTASV